tara:strand:+ start:708 stop:1067 length:360 start_codon:yes stop_codon:yes gene_type:complete
VSREVVIYHNPKCSKSRDSLELITSMGIKPKVKLYLEENISYEEINRILILLAIKPRDLLRRSEDEYEKYNLDNQDLNDSQIINIMISNPILIERPIVISNNSAAIGRPTDKILEILNQ